MKIKGKILKEGLNKVKSPKYILKEGAQTKQLTEQQLNMLIDSAIEEYIEQSGGNPYENLQFVEELFKGKPITENHISTVKTLIWANPKNSAPIKKYLSENVYMNKYKRLRKKSLTVLNESKQIINKALKSKASLEKVANMAGYPHNLFEDLVKCNRKYKKNPNKNKYLLNIVESYQAFNEDEMMEIYDGIMEMMPDMDEYPIDDRMIDGEYEDERGYNPEYDLEMKGALNKYDRKQGVSHNPSDISNNPDVDYNYSLDSDEPVGDEEEIDTRIFDSGDDYDINEQDEDESTWMENSYLDKDIQELESLIGESKKSNC